SIILPNRDHGHYIGTAIDAFLRQTRAHLELIVVDDASSDDSRDIVRDYARRDARVRLIELPEHHGINRAVSAGIAQADGEYVHIAGADDFVEPNFLENCVAQLERYPLAGLCFSDPSEFHPQGQRSVLFPLYLSQSARYFSQRDLAVQFARNYFHISANT